MFKLIFVLIAIVCILATDEFEEEWKSFQTKFNRQYRSPREANFRYQIFVQKLRKIQKHNEEYARGLHTYRSGINQFTDLTETEMKLFTSGIDQKLLQQHLNSEEGVNVPDFLRISSDKLPKSIDWRKKGAVTPVKDQGLCGSCWAFSVTGVMEGQYFLTTNQLVSFSEQELVDCSQNCFGCNGCYMTKAYEDIMQIGGIESEKSYPYKAVDGKCQVDKNAFVAKITNYTNLPVNNEDALMKAVALKGPISVGVYASNLFLSYSDGVFIGEDCPKGVRIDHAVLVVGYGTDEKTNQDYWIVKNSWGRSFGEEGYIKMLRGKNICSIASCGSYPNIVKE